ncbi:MAG TPA: 50S ribosomal protein L18 [Candidatus Acidoferrales bacterium]|nr:50S ribosomal protein L18 [Candidatus Acidoferrales bacterium]
MTRSGHRRQLHRRVRRKVGGTAARPRLAVFRSLRQTYAQLIDDLAGRTLASASSLDAEFRKQLKTGGNAAAGKLVGKLIGERALAGGWKQVVFDRGGYQYHGRVKALAEAAREAGLEF